MTLRRRRSGQLLVACLVLATALVAASAIASTPRTDDPPAPPGAAPPTTAPTAPPTALPAAPTPPAVQDAPPARTQRIRFLQYNIRYGSLGLGNVARDIERTGADVVMLNEVDDRRRTGGLHQPRTLARLLGMTSVFDGNIWTKRGLRGNAVLSRFPLGPPRRYDLHVPAGTRPRGLMQVRVAAPVVRFDAWVTHLNVVDGRLRQAQGTSARVGDPRCATVLGGDMNARPGRAEDQVLRTHLRDAWRPAGRGRPQTNFLQTKRIDYLYYDHATPVRAWVTPLRSSDHRGVVADLELDAAHGC